MIQIQTIIPVSLFKKDTKEYLTRLQTVDQAIMLTIHGRGAFVIQDVNSFMRLAELAELARFDLAIDQSTSRAI